MDVGGTLRKFILSECMFEEDESALKDDDELLAKGIIDSMRLLQLVQFVEEQFNISVSDEDLVPENFNTVNTVRSFVEEKQRTAANSARPDPWPAS